MVKKILSKKDFKKINQMKRPLVFVPMAADLLHHGHIRILKKSSKFGSVVVGLMTNTGLKKYKGPPVINYKQREEIISELKSVDYVIPINGLLYVEIAKALGASKILGSSTNQSKLSKLSNYGADTLVDTSKDSWLDTVLEATDGKGVDVLVDMLSGDFTNKNMEATKINGHLINIGRLAFHILL